MANNLRLISLWFSEYFRTCSVLRKQKSDDLPFLVTGHRGSPTTEIENTIPSFEKAMEEGANSLEIDLCVTKEGEVVLWHDWNPNDTTALLREAGFEPWVRFKPHPPAITDKFRKPVRELTLREFMEHYDYKEREREHATAQAEKPTLRDFFKWGAKRKDLLQINFDIKTPGDEAEFSIPILTSIKKLIEEFNPKFTAVIETTEPSVLKIMKEKYPHFFYAFDIEPPAGFIIDPSEYSAVNAAIENGTSFPVALRPRKITVANFTTYRRIVRQDVKMRKRYNNQNGMKLHQLIGGTVNKAKEMRCLIKLGIGGMQTDFPGRLRNIAEFYKKNM